MKAGIIAVVLVIIAIGLGAFFFLNQSPKPSTNTETPEEMQAENKMVIKDSKTIDSNLAIGADSANPSSEHGLYGLYSKDGFIASKANKKVLYFFATWCPECKEAEKDFQANLGKLPANVAIFKIHYNDPETSSQDKELAKKYGIVYQHTFVQVDNQGNEITKWNGGGFNKLISSIK